MSILADSWEGPCLHVEGTVVDGYNPEKTIDLWIRSLIPPMKTGDDFGIWLLWRLMQIELHETRELLHRDGKPFVDPHNPIEP